MSRLNDAVAQKHGQVRSEKLTCVRYTPSVKASLKLVFSLLNRVQHRMTEAYIQIRVSLAPDPENVCATAASLRPVYLTSFGRFPVDPEV